MNANSSSKKIRQAILISDAPAKQTACKKFAAAYIQVLAGKHLAEAAFYSASLVKQEAAFLLIRNTTWTRAR